MVFFTYETLLISIISVSWFYTLRKLYAMYWEWPSDARDLAEHCSNYAIHKTEFANEENSNSGNALVVSRAQYCGRTVVLKRWHGATVPLESRILFTKCLVQDLDRWRALDHPNIGPILGLVLHMSNLPALVVPSYRTVSAVLAGSPDTDVLNLLRGVAAALSYLHAQTPLIAHGDIKGSTVLVSPAGTALLSDIGVAAIPQPPDWGVHGVDDARWQAPELMDPRLRPGADGGEGTFVRSPEGRVHATRESDVYAVGMLAYEMYTRARPFASIAWAASVVVKAVRGERPPRPPPAQSPQLTDEMWELIQLCWAQDWCRRPRIDVLVAALDVMVRVRALEGAQ